MSEQSHTEQSVSLTARGEGEGFLRAARKPWECIECKAAISPGDQYFEDMTDAPPRYGATGARFCTGCALAHGQVKGSRS